MNSELRRRLGYALRGSTYADDLLASILGTTGNLIYVDSGSGSASWDGKSADRACATIDQAINNATASQGDKIIVLPGHAETVSTAGGITADVVGIDIIGLGRGNDRPTVTLSATASTVICSAANVGFRNIVFVGTVDALVVGIPVTAAHVNFTECEFNDTTTTNTVTWFTLSADADYFECIDCDNHGTDTAGNTSFLTMAAADHVKIKNLKSHGDFSAGNIVATAAPTDILIEDCKLENINAADVCIELFSAATGWLVGNSYMIATDGQVTAVNTPGSVGQFESYFVNNLGEAGKIQGTVSA